MAESSDIFDWTAWERDNARITYFDLICSADTDEIRPQTQGKKCDTKCKAPYPVRDVPPTFSQPRREYVELFTELHEYYQEKLLEDVYEKLGMNEEWRWGLIQRRIHRETREIKKIKRGFDKSRLEKKDLAVLQPQKERKIKKRGPVMGVFIHEGPEPPLRHQKEQGAAGIHLIGWVHELMRENQRLSTATL
ncbi:hypothetical protein K469DRAFT_753755 [Zopfia rhizophila CBS 207.26]|uniref:Uncharacterized protein n=1 Tax=Zopfia rhizophila CBS 207.26 TaxID=1314779 RepID=A0A6A6DND3_9PEZI|nr:hypothetical protein K469DRAFT_753755 [Zopfia rhizophila CBS 207.26]